MAYTKALAPCPFCGGAARHLPRHEGFYEEKAICDKCQIDLPPAAWNRRACAAATAPIKDHIIAQAVNRLTDVAREFHSAGQLRSRIADIVVPLLQATPLSK